MKTGFFVVLSTMLMCAALSADIKETEEFSFDVEPGARLSLENINGSIEIVGGNGSKVDIIAHKKAGTQEYMDELRVVIDADESYVRIETRHPDSSGGWFNWGNDSSGSVSYEIAVPSDIDLDAIETVNGDVKIEAVAGDVKASTVNGSLTVKDLAADVDLETVNGSVRAEFSSLGEGQRVNAEAVNGKIALMLPANASADVQAETVNGSIDAEDFGLKAEKGFVGRDLSGTIGEGGARVSADTVNGSIRIKQL
jgi:DUF4097 and DUF4098 domain-containing protein YvlB